MPRKAGVACSPRCFASELPWFSPCSLRAAHILPIVQRRGTVRFRPKEQRERGVASMQLGISLFPSERRSNYVCVCVLTKPSHCSFNGEASEHCPVYPWSHGISFDFGEARYDKSSWTVHSTSKQLQVLRHCRTVCGA